MKIGTLMNAELTREIRQVVNGNGKKVWHAAIIKTSTEGKRTIVWIREFKSKAAAERFEG